jgi:hypothetical protein
VPVTCCVIGQLDGRGAKNQFTVQGIGVSVGGEAEGVLVRVGRGVDVAVTKRVAVKVALGVSVGISVSDGTSVSVGAIVGVGVKVMVGVTLGISVRVGVGNSAPLVPGAMVAALISCGAAGVAPLSQPESNVKATTLLIIA